MHQVDVFLIEVWLELDLHLDVEVFLRLFSDREWSFADASDLGLPAVCDTLDIFANILFAIINGQLHGPSICPSWLLLCSTKHHASLISIGKLAKAKLYVLSLFDELCLRSFIHNSEFFCDLLLQLLVHLWCHYEGCSTHRTRHSFLCY